MMRLVNVGFRGFMAKAGCRGRWCQWLCAALLVGSCQSGSRRSAGVIALIFVLNDPGELKLVALKVARRGAVPPFIVMEVLRDANERAARGENVLHLEVGQPEHAAPRARSSRPPKRALDRDQIGYTEALGIPPLRQRIARHYRDMYGVSVDPERVVATTGSSGAFLLSFLAAFDPGDRVALAEPGYPAYRNILRRARHHAGQSADRRRDALSADARAAWTRSAVRLDGSDRRQPVESRRHDDRRRARFVACATIAAARQIRLVSDEIYHGITYGMKPTTALALGEDAIVVNSFSKYFSMTGWRLGWMVAPTDLLRPIECLAQNLFISPPTLPQIAASAAFDCGDELDANVAPLRRATARCCSTQLPRAGFDRLAPADGAFYIYADVARLTNDSDEFCRRMLAETGVAATPGVDFDAERGHQFMRFSFAGSAADIAAAADRLLEWRK